MTPASRALRTMVLAAATALLAVGCGARAPEQAASPRGAAPATPPPEAAPVAAAPAPRGDGGPDVSAGSTTLLPLEGELLFDSPEAGFTAVFPPGCGQMRTRIYPKGATESTRTVVSSYCDLAGRSGEGAMVETYFAERDEAGGPPTPRNATRLIEKIAAKRGVRVVRQGTLTRRDLEGVRLFCQRAGGSGEMWIQGMLAGERIYIMSAWRASPDGLGDAQIARFFDSFRLK